MLTAAVRRSGVALQAVVLLSVQVSFATAQCVQAEDPHMCRLLDRDAIVFEATVEQIEIRRLPEQEPKASVIGPSAERLVHLLDVRAIKGVPQHLLVAPVFGSEDCFFQFREGQRYLIVATRLSDGRLAPSDLTRTVETSAGLQAFLQTVGTLTQGELWGNVSMPAEWTEWDITYGPVPQVRVTVRGPVTRSTITDVHGEYRFTNLPWGVYTVRVDLERTAPFLEPLESQTVEFQPGTACADVGFRAESRTSIEGTIVDENGDPARGIFLEVHPADYFNAAQGGSPGFGISTDSDGRFKVSDLPPGRYVVGVNSELGPTSNSPYLEAYAATTRGETIVALAIGGHAVLEPLRLSGARPGTISGVVLSKDGTAVPGFDVSLSWMTVRGNTRRLTPLKTDEGGRFHLAAWEGIQYELEIGPHDAPSAHVAVPKLDEPIIIKLKDR